MFRIVGDSANYIEAHPTCQRVRQLGNGTKRWTPNVDGCDPDGEELRRRALAWARFFALRPEDARARGALLRRGALVVGAGAGSRPRLAALAAERRGDRRALSGGLPPFARRTARSGAGDLFDGRAH